MSMSFVPDTKTGNTTIKTDYHYYLPRKPRKYYQHYDGANAALEAADRFIEKRTNAISSNVKHDEKRQCFLVTIVEPTRRSNA